MFSRQSSKDFPAGTLPYKFGRVLSLDSTGGGSLPRMLNRRPGVRINNSENDLFVWKWKKQTFFALTIEERIRKWFQNLNVKKDNKPWKEINNQFELVLFILNYCRLNYWSFELPHVVPRAIVQTTNSSKSQ